MQLKSLTTKNPAWRRWLPWVLLFLFFALFSYLIPKSVDDWWYALEFRKSPARGGILATMRFYWETLNGRMLGNGLALVFSHAKLLRALFHAGILCLTCAGLYGLSGLKERTRGGVAITFVLMMAVPVTLLRETYAWDSGFFIYLTPFVPLCGYLCLIRPLFSGERISDGPGKAIAAFLLGVAVQLFSENVMVYVLVMAVGVLVWHIIATKRLSLTTLAFLIGAILGAMLAFSSPVYRMTLAGEDSYRTAPNSLGMLLYIFKLNYPAFSHFSLENATLLQLCISACSIVLLVRSGAKTDLRLQRLKPPLVALLAALPVYFYFMSMEFSVLPLASPAFETLTQLFNSSYAAIAFDALLYLLYVASVACVLRFYCGSVRLRNLGLFALLSAVVISVPMLIVQPVSYRCFMLPYLFYVLLALLLIGGVLERVGAQGGAGGRLAFLYPAAYGIVAAICVCYLMLYAKCPEIEQARVAHIQEQMRLRAESITLPEYPCEPYLFLPDDGLQAYYYYESFADIPFTFLPYDEWKALYAK